MDSPSVFLEFDGSYVYRTLFRLVSDMRITMDFASPSSENEHCASVQKLSSFLEVVLEIPYTSIKSSFLPDFTTNFLKFIAKYHSNYAIGVRGLQLLKNWLRIECLEHSLGKIYTVSNLSIIILYTSVESLIQQYFSISCTYSGVHFERAELPGSFGKMHGICKRSS